MTLHLLFWILCPPNISNILILLFPADWPHIFLDRCREWPFSWLVALFFSHFFDCSLNIIGLVHTLDRDSLPYRTGGPRWPPPLPRCSRLILAGSCGTCELHLFHLEQYWHLCPACRVFPTWTSFIPLAGTNILMHPAFIDTCFISLCRRGQIDKQVTAVITSHTTIVESLKQPLGHVALFCGRVEKSCGPGSNEA